MLPDLTQKALTAVAHVAKSFARHSDARENLDDIFEILDAVMAYRHGTVTLMDAETGDLLVEASKGIKRERLAEVRYKKGEGLTGIIMESASALAIPKIKNDPRFLNRLAVYEADAAFIGVPIEIGGSIQGVFSVSIDPSERYRLDDHVSIVSIFGDMIGGVISRLRKVEREKEKIIREKDALHGQLKSRFRPDNMIGVSKAMDEVFETIRQVAKWNTTVLIRGESGTGKELVAKAIHFQSVRSSGPFVKLNCAALPNTLLESELFGHETGAFTGATKSRAGRFELADKGTIFLDEIGDTTPDFQTKLLRVLQEGQFERLGGTETLSVDVRIIAATHVDLEKAVAEKMFREDLYYRLNVMPIYLPPLRERNEDIPYLVEHFLSKFGQEHGTSLSIDADALRLLKNCTWPGNVRELENCVHRMAVVCKGPSITRDDVPCTKGQCLSQLIYTQSSTEPGLEVSKILEIENERERVIEALKRSGWVQAKAARLLKMTPHQIAYRIQKLKIEMKEM